MDLNGKRLRLLYPDIHGLERGKYLFGKVAESGHAAFCVGVYPLTHDREILMVPNTQFDVGLPDIDVELDRESLRPSWEPETVDRHRRRPLPGRPGRVGPTPRPASSRRSLAIDGPGTRRSASSSSST